jgi:predicted XRE-type DNA-binding protein
MNQDNDRLEFQVSSGNVFADMELEDADELYARAQLGFQVQQILKEKGYTQQQAAELLNIKQPEVSNLMRECVVSTICLRKEG